MAQANGPVVPGLHGTMVASWERRRQRSLPRHSQADQRALVWRYTGTLGKLWRQQREQLPPRVRELHSQLLVACKQFLLPHTCDAPEGKELLAMLSALAGRIPGQQNAAATNQSTTLQRLLPMVPTASESVPAPHPSTVPTACETVLAPHAHCTGEAAYQLSRVAYLSGQGAVAETSVPMGKPAPVPHQPQQAATVAAMGAGRGRGGSSKPTRRPAVLDVPKVVQAPVIVCKLDPKVVRNGTVSMQPIRSAALLTYLGKRDWGPAWAVSRAYKQLEGAVEAALVASGVLWRGV